MSRIADAAVRSDFEAVRPLRPQEFERIRELAYRTFGLDLKPGKEELVSTRLRRLVAHGGFRTFHEYYRHVLADTTGQSLSSMIDALVTNHTTFFREPDHFEFLRRKIIPHLAGRDAVDLWCAACSTGEEVWTLACVLNDCLPARRIQIIATDISNRALQFAGRGTYPAERCQALPPEWRRRYFATEKGPGGGLRVTPNIRAQATFQRLNLVEDFRWPRRFPLIFCRNVMIYFDRPTQERVVQKLAQWLEPGGYLFVGHAESLTRVAHSLEYIQPAIYRKPREREGRWSRSS